MARRTTSGNNRLALAAACLLLVGVQAAGGEDSGATDLATSDIHGNDDADNAEERRERELEAQRRRDAIKSLQDHAKLGYRPGEEVISGARGGGAMSLVDYVEALLGWDEHSWARAKQVGTIGCVAPPLQRVYLRVSSVD